MKYHSLLVQLTGNIRFAIARVPVTIYPVLISPIFHYSATFLVHCEAAEGRRNCIIRSFMTSAPRQI
jgi:hypothetical protein